MVVSEFSMSHSVEFRISLHNAPLLVGKERGERIVHVAVVAVEQANHLGEVGALHVLRRLLGKGLELGRIGSRCKPLRRR